MRNYSKYLKKKNNVIFLFHRVINRLLNLKLNNLKKNWKYTTPE